MNAEQLAEIKARADKAAEGPWFIDGIIDVHSTEGGEVAAVWAGGDNIEFIAHAREDIPNLLAEVERLDTANSDLRAISIEMASEIALLRKALEFYADEKCYVEDCGKVAKEALQNGD